MLGHLAHITFCRTEPSLADEIAKGGDTVVLVELVDGGVPPVSSVVQGVKRHFPAVPVLGYCWLGPAVSAEIVLCARAGLDALALRGYDDLTMMVRRALAHERGDDAIVLLELESMLPAALLPWARAVLERAREGPNVGMIARAIGCGPRTMERAAQALGAAPPARLISCVRLLYAARLLAFRRLGVDDAAAHAGYPSGIALRRAFRREHLAAPVELRTTARYALVRESVRRRLSLPGAEHPAPAATTPPIMACVPG
jgi:AraC-like DNA-binding protein